MNAQVSRLMKFEPAYSQITAVERTFVDAYVADIERTAEQTGQRLLAVLNQPYSKDLDRRAITLLAQPLVRAAIAERVQQLADLYDVSIARTLKEVVSIAHSSIANYIKLDGYGEPEIDLRDTTPEQMAAVQSFVIDEKPNGGRKITFKLHDKMAGLTLLMRYQGLLGTDGNAHHAAAEKSVRQATLPATVDDETAADLYAKQING